MKTRLRFFQPDEERKGAALVEMALVLPIFMTVTLGIIEFGRAMMVGQMVTNAARESVRLAIIDGSSNADVQAHVNSFLQSAINVDPSFITTTITITPAPGSTTTGNEVANAAPKDLITVNISVPFSEVSYLSPQWLDTANMTAAASMRHE